MYYPLQIPSILDKKFIQNVEYKEEKFCYSENYIMCIWTMKSYKSLENSINNVILPDGCIDLIVDFVKKEIFFTATSKATLHFPLKGNIDFMGIRMRPGVFYNFFKKNCQDIMDNFVSWLQIEKEYNLENIFKFDCFKDRVDFLNEYIKEKIEKHPQDSFGEIINTIQEKNDIKYVSEVASRLGYSERQVYRIFKERCGVSVKSFLNIIRLHKSLKLIIGNESNKLIDLAQESGFYDESHLIKEIKKYCGISPKDLVNKYHMS